MTKCKYCGKELKKGKYCNKKHYFAFLKEKGQSSNANKSLEKLNDDNLCVQCHKPMSKDRISAYCEECELHIEYVVEDTLNY